VSLSPDFRLRRRLGLGRPRESKTAPLGRLSKMSQRAWPTELQRPGESVVDYCRRLDVYENLRAGAVHLPEGGR
jgi:hypothetical protein